MRNVFSQPQSNGCFTWRETALGLKLVYIFSNFIISLPATYIRHSRSNCQDCQGWSNYRELLARLLRQKDCRGTAAVNGAFEVLPRQLYCRRIYSWNSNAGTQTHYKAFGVLHIKIIIKTKSLASGSWGSLLISNTK